MPAAVIDGIREYVYELKFYVAEQQATPLLQWVRTHLDPDPHGTGADGDSYRVSSLYFDTADHAVLARRGSYARSKYRVRRYDGGGDAMFLERKTRGKYRVFKRRAAVQAAQLPDLLEATPVRGWGGYWFHRRLLARGLRPVCRIDYQRIARIGQGSYGPLRLTLDDDLTAWHAPELSFDGQAAGRALSDTRRILELKFGHAMPAVFKQLIQEFSPELTGISKYRLASAALGLAPELTTAASTSTSASTSATAGDGASRPPGALDALASSTC